ncbi:hypothetical protein GALL_296930 [mine drainage metagenome]|uniref:Glutaredoxin 2 n=1 Tax=mine drainage metagenome TaxID=410659 RepID=A0A1J5QYR2_9ZZZZ
MLILYGTEGCHLCHEAQSLLQQLALVWHDVDIIDDDRLLETYGTRIPVLHLHGKELGWPFQRQDVLRFLDAAAS